MIDEADAPAMAPEPLRFRPDVELMRVVAILMVVAIHSTAPTIIAAERFRQEGVAYWLALAANEVSRAGVPIFFAITGWVLLRRSTPGDLPWLRQRIARILVPLLVWSTIEAVDAVVVARAVGQRPWPPGGQLAWVGDEIAKVLAGPGTRTSLWFLYFALALTVAIWLIQAARTIDPSSRPVYAGIAVVLIVAFGAAAAFRTTLSWQAFGWSIGYAALGYAIIESAGRPRLGLVAFVVGGVATTAGIAWLGYDTWPSAYFSPLVVLTTLGGLWMMTHVTLTPRLATVVTRLGALTFGVYLFHPLVLDVMRLSSEPGGLVHEVPLAARVALTWAVAVVVSFAVVALWHRSRILVRILG
jgi:surface polysaccharide O-acyltransferase-like enzyme